VNGATGCIESLERLGSPVAKTELVHTQSSPETHTPLGRGLPGMYVGRLLVAAPGLVAYRVSSRSFPNRQTNVNDGSVAVVPTEAAAETDNPYVAYDCLESVDGRVVAGNGSHVDPIAGKLSRGVPVRDALSVVLGAMDFERDDYDTPRIAAVVGSDEASVGVVRRDALLVEAVEEPTLVATYEEDRPRAFEFDAAEAGEAARAAYDLEFEHAVCAAAATVDGSDGEHGVAVATYDGRED
jgi:IMP cyclohydrolase